MKAKIFLTFLFVFALMSFVSAESSNLTYGDFQIQKNKIQTVTFNSIDYQIQAPEGCTAMNPPRDMVIKYGGKEVAFDKGYNEKRALGNGVQVWVQGCGPLSTYFTLYFMSEVNVTEGCFDSDGDRNYFEHGEVTAGETTTQDYCEGDTLSEGYCKNGNFAKEEYKCENGCMAGRCLRDYEQSQTFQIKKGEEQEITFLDTTYTIKSPSCTGMNPPRDMEISVGGTSFWTFGKGFNEERKLSDKVSVIVTGCPGGTETFPMTFIGRSGVGCFDSDGGKNYFEYGQARVDDELGGTTIINDLCYDNTLKEVYCDNDNFAYEDFNCVNGCMAGECKALTWTQKFVNWFKNLFS